MSRFFASLAPFYGWIVAAILLVMLVAVIVQTRKNKGDKNRQFQWGADKPADFEATVMVDSTEVSSWRAASRQDMPPPRPAGPIRVAIQDTQPSALSGNPGS